MLYHYDLSQVGSLAIRTPYLRAVGIEVESDGAGIYISFAYQVS
jgi:hypothetical protein